MKNHIIVDSTYAADFIDFVNLNSKDDYFFVIKHEERSCVQSCTNKKIINMISESDIKDVLKKIKRNDTLIIHGLFSNRIIMWLFLHRNILKKHCKIIIWGGDLYLHKKIIDKTATYKECIFDLMKKYVFKNVSVLAMDMPSDYELLREWYKFEREMTYITYPQMIDLTMLNDSLKYRTKKDDNSKIRIILGNSATETNMHMEAIKWLSRYRECGIEIICPLSYGDKTYAEKVIEYGEKIFGSKFVAITEYMDSIAFSKLIGSAEIAIFNNNRQQAMGTITLAAYLGLKVYIKKSTTMWRQYVEVGGCCFYPAESLANIGFTELIKSEPKDQEINHNYFQQILDMENMKKIWKIILE